MNIKPLLLHMFGVIVDERLHHLSAKEERIIETLYRVSFENYNELLAASDSLRDLDGSEVVDCISGYWKPRHVLDGAKNLERIFKAPVDLNRVIGNFFADDNHWRFSRKSSEWLDWFNQRYRRNITVDDVTRNISMDYLIDSHDYGPGLCGFFRFVLKNGGDPKLFIKKVASEVDRLPHVDIFDVICFMDPYIEDGDIDIEKVFMRVDWRKVKEDEDDFRKFTDFFRRRAPELLSRIPD